MRNFDGHVYSYNNESSGRITSVAPIDQSGVLEPGMPEVLEVDGNIRLRFSDHTKTTLSTILRSNQGYVDYPSKSLGSIPHDFVQSALSPVEQSHVIGGQTPDIVIRNEDGLIDIIEIATRNVFTYELARHALSEKINKYAHHVDDGRVDRMNVVVVYLNGVITLNDVLDMETVQVLVRAYRMGLSILEVIKQTTTITVNPEIEPLHKEMNWFKNIKFPERPLDGRQSRLILSREFRDRLKNSDHLFTLRYLSESLRMKCPGSIAKWMLDLPGRKCELDTLIHLPLITECEHSDYTYAEAPEYAPIVPLFREGEEVRRDLRAWRELPADVRKRTRKLEGRHEFRVKLSESCRIGLASRGVLKKEIQSLQVVQEMDNLQSESYSGTCPTHDIEDFLTIGLSDRENDLISVEQIEEFHIADQSGFDPHDSVSELLNTDLFRSITLLDLIVREVILTMKTNPDDLKSQGLYSFSTRRIGDYNVIIRTTRYNSTSDTPIFFMLTSAHPFKPIHSIFEAVYYTNSVYHTKFVSLSRLRAEHFCNILPQCLSLYLMIYDELGPGLSPTPPTLRQLNSVSYAAKSVLLTLLEDKEYTSRNLQQMRYYYMEVLGTNVDHAEKVYSKLESPCRSRLFLHFVRNMISCYQHVSDKATNPAAMRDEADKIDATTYHGSDKSDTSDSETDSFLHDIRANEPDIEVTCFLRCKHTGLQSLLIPMYMSVLHNKNEMEKTLSAKQIVGKILQEEYKLEASEHCTGDMASEPDLASYKSHDWSYRIVKSAALMLKTELQRISQGEDLHSIVMRSVYRTTMDDLASTKSSHSGICTTETRSSSDLSKIGSRDKCFVQVLRMSPPSARLIDNVEHLRDLMVKENDCRVNVQMFKKNQIGGTREILILDFVSRCLVRLVEDMSRSLCEMHPFECLTKPQSKGNMTATHSFKVKSQRFAGDTLTWRASLDKTTWAQQFVNPTFYTILSTLLPDYSEFIAFVLDCHTRKRLELPRDLVRSFIESKKSHLSDYQVSKLREEFLGFSDPVVTDGPFLPYINNASNMMQGILHYTSSLLHTCYTVLLRAMMEEEIKKTGNRLVFSSQVSSDDSGILATVLFTNPSSDKSTLPRLIDKRFQEIICTLDKAFSVRTSIQKSTMTFRPVYEFNSAFYSGNNFTCPLIKFVARSCDDTPSESLRSRVINMNNSLREVRANGGSGALCSVISVCQKMSFYMNLGLGSMTFYEEFIEPIRMYKISHIGAFVSSPSILAGIYGADFSDYYMCLTDRATHNLMSVLHRRPMIGGKLLSDLSAHYRAWPTDKYKAMMERLEITPGFSHDLSFEDLEFLFRPVMSWQDVKNRVELSISNQSTARSFTFLTRCETIMSSSYILWDKIFMHSDGGLSLEELVSKAARSEESEGPVSLDRLFPNIADLASVYSALECSVEYNHAPSKYIYRPHVYEPLHSGLHDMKLLKEVLANKWYGMIVKSSKTTIDLAFETLQEMLPWLSDSRELSLERSGMSSPIELINYITMLSERVKPVKLVSMGGTRRNRSIIENVCLLNNFRGKICFLRSRDDYVDNIDIPGTSLERGLLIRKLQNRLADWSQLILHFYDDWTRVDQFCNALTDDIKHLASKYRMDLRSSLRYSSESRTSSEVLSLIDDSVWRTEIVFNADRSFESHIGEYKLDNYGRHRGDTTIIKKTGTVLTKFRIIDGVVKNLVTNTSQIDHSQLLRSYPKLDWSSVSTMVKAEVHLRVPDSIKLHKGKLWLCNSSTQNTHYLCPLLMTHGFFLDPLECRHIKDVTALLWCSRVTNSGIINKLLSADPRVAYDLKIIARSSMRLVNTAKVRAQFDREEAQSHIPEEGKGFSNLTGFTEDLFAGYGLISDPIDENYTANFTESFYRATDVVAVNYESDLYSMSFRNEPDIGYISIHPLMTEIIRMINFQDIGESGLHRVALDVALEEGIISQARYDLLLGESTMETLLNAFFK